MSDEIDPIMGKKCPYCGEIFVVDDGGQDDNFINHLHGRYKEGWSDDLMCHLLDHHKEEIESEYDILNQVIDENWNDLMDDYKHEIREMFNDNGDDIVFKYGDDLIEGAVNDLIENAEVSEVKD